MPNLYGDVLSDVAAQITGSVGLAGSANIGDYCSMFEAIHGSAPRRAGQNLANPSGLLHGAILMLVHIGQADAPSVRTTPGSRRSKKAFTPTTSTRRASRSRRSGTREFADAVIARMGKKPQQLKPVEYNKNVHMNLAIRPAGKPPMKIRVGVDLFIDRRDGNPDDHRRALQLLEGAGNETDGDQQSRHESVARTPIRIRTGAITGRAASKPTAASVHRAARREVARGRRPRRLRRRSRPRDSSRSTASVATRSRRASSRRRPSAVATAEPGGMRDTPGESRAYLAERWQSGRMHSLGKRAEVTSLSGVRISPSPNSSVSS